ncbi:unnamed protein product [Nezara viridula]|uniref:Uncharacterized protein n=1 Tax=Nezara viridula TaxID=85310 RepID=A0A9P0E303_NEZVI|nr:unnamed protein product [Nezara viridula]
MEWIQMPELSLEGGWAALLRDDRRSEQQEVLTLHDHSSWGCERTPTRLVNEIRQTKVNQFRLRTRPSHPDGNDDVDITFMFRQVTVIVIIIFYLPITNEFLNTSSNVMNKK